MKVKDCCTLHVRSCRPETDLAAVASIMWEQDCGVVPVVGDDGKVLGVVTDRDICMAAATRSTPVSQIRAGQLMTGKTYTCSLDDDLSSAVRMMAAKAVRRLPVLGTRGELAGVLSLTDLVMGSHDPKTARPGEMTWAEVMPLMQSICRPRSVKIPAATRQAVAVGV